MLDLKIGVVHGDDVRECLDLARHEVYEADTGLDMGGGDIVSANAYLSAQQGGIDLSVPSLQQLPAEVSLANQLLAKRHFSWTQFLSALEAAIPQHVSIQTIRLDPGSAVVHMTGLAVTVEDVTALTVTLQDHALFRDPVLGQHRVGPDGLVEFDLTLRYRQPGV